MTKTYEIKKFNDIIEIGTKFVMNWFRGQSKEYNNLTPKVFRPEYQTDAKKIFKPKFEFDTVENFKRYAPSIIRNIPSSNDNLSWLLIMQHHSFPTRLLDWSENILVALFFAIIDSPNENGEIWSMLPWKLNENSGFWGLPLPEHPLLRFLSNEPFHNVNDNLVKEYKLKEVPEKPIAFLPNVFLPRISSQMSAFTIHPKPFDRNSIEELIQDENYLTRYIVPKDLKLEFEKKLSYLGISYRTLFPDLEGLAKDFKRNENYLAWGQPPHPKI